jgi:carboxyl-terminal processing protease
VIIRYTAAVGKSAAVFGIQKPDGAQRGTEERKNMKNKEFKKGIAIGVASTLVVTGTVFASYQKMLFPKGNALSDVKTVQKLNYLEELIDKEYLDEKDESSLREGLYAGLLAGLKDPYSTYYTAEQYKELNTSNEGSYVGIGAVLQKDDAGGAKIIQLYEGGPGEQVGLKKGDVIKAVDGTDVTDKETSDIASMVRDSEKDSVMLTIQRENEEKTRDVKVEIRDVEIQTVSHEMLSEDTGYIRISEFSEVTSDQYKKAFADLKDQGMKKLVVDLRDNPGGLLTAVCGVLRQILPEGLIVYTEDKNGKREEETCDGKNKLDMPLAVLVNGNSASASEIFAGAVKDYGIGTIVGTTTYGKGVVQTIHSLTDGSAVKITIAKYFTPKGNDINKKGINPDVEAELSGDITDWTELTHKEDTQLQTALKEIGQS